MLSLTVKKTGFHNFNLFVSYCPLQNHSLFSDENAIIIAWTIPFHFFYFIATVFREDKWGIILKVNIGSFKNPGAVGS